MARLFTLALDDLRHFFSWAVKHDHYTAKNPFDGIGYEDVKQLPYEPFTDDELRGYRALRDGSYTRRPTGIYGR